MSDPADPREPQDAWLADTSSTLTEQRPLATSGKVEIWIEPEEYEEYSRLKNGLSTGGSESAGDPDTPPAETDEDPADGRGEDVAAFMAHINTTPTPVADTSDGAEGEDDFLAQFTHTPRRSPAPPTGRPGSAALEGIAAARGRIDPPAGAQRRVRGGGWRRRASLAGVVVVLAGVASVLLQSHNATRTRDPSSVISPVHADPLASFGVTVSAIDHEVKSAADNAISRERAAAAEHRAAALRRLTAREVTDRRRAAAAATARAARTRTGHRTPAASQTTARFAPSATTASSESAPTQTATIAAPTTTTPERSTTSSTTSTATTPTQAYGQGGVLGAGHSSGSS